MADINQIEDLKHSFNVKPELGDRLPNPKDVADKTTYYLKDGDTHQECIMVQGSWYRKVVNSLSQTVLQKV